MGGREWGWGWRSWWRGLVPRERVYAVPEELRRDLQMDEY